MPRRSISNTGLALALLSGATFGTSGSFAASLIAAGWTPAAAVMSRAGIACLVLTAPALWQLRARRLDRRAVRSLAAYGLVAVAGTQLCYFNALSHLSVAIALLLEYSAVLLVVAWNWARHGQRPRRLTLAGGVASLAGLVLVLDLAGSHRIDLVGVLWGLGAAAGLAFFYIVSSVTADVSHPLVFAWGGFAVGAVLLGAVALTGLLPVRAPLTDVTLLHNHVTWVVPVLGMAIVAAVVSYIAGILAARLLGAKVASFVGLTEVLFAIAFAWLLLGQPVDLVQGIGGLFVIGGIALVRIDELRGTARRQETAARQLDSAASS